MILYGQWLQLPIQTRHKIASEFGIIKKGPTEVFNDTIKSDGYLIKDIESALTLDSLQKYFGVTETNLAVLWSFLIDRIEGRDIQILDINTPIKIIEPQIISKPRGRPKKNV